MTKDIDKFLLSEDVRKIVCDLAWKMHMKCSHVFFDDFVQAGYLAVVRAFPIYDESKGTKLTTWAAIVARREMIDLAKKESRWNRNLGIEIPQQGRDTTEDIIYKDLLQELSRRLSPLAYKILSYMVDNVGRSVKITELVEVYSIKNTDIIHLLKEIKRESSFLLYEGRENG